MKNRSLDFLSVIAIIVLLAACNFSRSTPIQEAPSTETLAAPTATSTPAPASFTIVPGALMHWWDGSTFIYVPAGAFLMGDAQAEEGDNIPAHQVSLDGFWMHQSEVTNRMYAQCVAAGVCSPPVSAPGTANRFQDNRYQNHPVVNVTWQEALDYCEWIGGTLLTEAQWEWAARGETGDPYPWGDEDPSCSRLNYADCALPSFTTLVNSYPLGLSPFNAADMAGNVFEWVYDWYGEDYYANSPASNPTGPETGEQRVVRSSGFRTAEPLLPVTKRFSQTPDTRRDDLGFRCRLTGETLQFPPPPMCTLISYAPDPAVPGNPPSIPPEFDLPSMGVWAYCGLDNNGNQYGTLKIQLGPPGTDPSEFSISSPNGTLNCTPDSTIPLLFYCTGSAVHPGDLVTVSTCLLSADTTQVTSTAVCPPLYSLDPVSDLCFYMGSGGPLMCQAPNVPVPGYGCLPPPVNGECPAGYTQAEYQGQPVCIPVGGPSCTAADCPAICPPGLTFNSGQFCCDYPADQTPVCPTGYVYDTSLNTCVTEVPHIPGCVSAMFMIPTCAPEDGDEPDQPNQPTGCWITFNFGAGQITQCVSPCPAGIPNQGPCTP
ncbi:MAG: SUMF1/EgtB/PvdO family nonheme iron enzyme [Anaerolineales bacterium]